MIGYRDPPLIDPALAGGRLVIDAAALARNYRHLAALAAPGECAAVVKADGYGLGIGTVAPTLIDAGCTTFFVARASEGVALREIAPRPRVFVLDGVHDGTLSAIRVNGLIPVLGSKRQIGLWREAAGGEPCALHVDTGMNRLGLCPDEFAGLAGDGAFGGLNVVLLMTHPACADDPSHPLNAVQRERFAAARARMADVPASYCNSAALVAGGPALDLSRPGIALYGGEAVNGAAPLETVATLEARIVQHRTVERGESVGYGATWVAERRSRLAVCAVGYADGFPRASGTGVPLRDAVPGAGVGAMGGVRVPVVGRISMDLTIFDVTDVPPHADADHIELFGPTIPLDEAARAAGTIGYELLTGLGRRYGRSVLHSPSGEEGTGREHDRLPSSARR